jgi:7-keto-8-aminopelargonate synthetase-like enzyme
MKTMLSEKTTLLRDYLQPLADRGLLQLTSQDATVDGRHVTIGSRKLVHFGSCSYVGLETDPRLKQGACDAVQRFGTQFASSRAYLSCGLYTELEELLERMFGAHVVVAQTTSLAHFAALPTIVWQGDAVIFDRLVHNSAQAVAPTLREAGVTCSILPHNDVEELERRITELRSRHRRIWYVADGVYSMAGNIAPIKALYEMLARHECLHLYIDDSHGISWTGLHGSGVALENRPLHPRVVVVLSLAKAFSASGAAMVFPDRETAKLVRTCGSTMIFSGPLQPSLLGAAIASARIHLSDEIVTRQLRLRERVDLFNELARSIDLRLATTAPTPVRFVKIGSEADACAVTEGLMDRGFYANVAQFPAVARGAAGIRIAVTLHHTLDDIRQLMGELAVLCRPAAQLGIREVVGGALPR